jgi:ParB/RepB/Spo0J family partition protein
MPTKTAKNSTRNTDLPEPSGHTDGEYCAALPLAGICTWDKNPRKHFEEAGLLELVQSIEQHGLQQPIVVRALDATHYQIVMGERRYRACSMLGMTTIPATVRVDLSDVDAMTLAVIENCQRRDLSAIEEAQSFQALLDEGKTQIEVGEMLGMPQSTIANRVRLLKLPESVQQLIAEGLIGPSHAKALLRFEAFPEILVEMAQVAAAKSAPVKDMEKGLPFWEVLKGAKLVRVLDHATKFPMQGCHTCPHKAYVHVEQWPYDFCMKPDEFDRKQEAAKAYELEVAAVALEKARQSAGKVQERMARLGITSGTLPASVGSVATPEDAAAIREELPHIRDWQHGTYALCDRSDCPEECTEACPCRLIIRGYGDRLEKVCIDPARFNQMKAAATRQKKKDLRVVFDADLAEIGYEASLGPNSHFAERVVAAVLAQHLDLLHIDDKRKVADRMALRTPPLPGVVVTAMKDAQTRESHLRQALGKCNMGMLIRLAAETLAVHELDQALQMPHDFKPIVEFLLERKKAPPSPPADVVRIVVDPPVPRSDEAYDRIDSAEFETACSQCGELLPKFLLGFPFTTEQKAKDTQVLRLTSGIVVIKRDEMEHCYCLSCAQDLRICRVCGCTHEVPCEEDEEQEDSDVEYVGGTCCWVEEDLCSACVGVEVVSPVIPEQEMAAV